MLWISAKTIPYRIGLRLKLANSQDGSATMHMGTHELKL